MFEMVKKHHKQHHKKAPVGVVFVPGRLAFIGEHLEEHGGHALLGATKEGVTLAYGEHPEREIRYFDDTMESPRRIDPLAEPGLSESQQACVVEAVMHKLHKELGDFPKGVQLTMTHDLPQFASYAGDTALALAIIEALCAMFGCDIEAEKRVRIVNGAFRDILRTSRRDNDLITQTFAKKDHLVYNHTVAQTHALLPFKFDHLVIRAYAPDKVHDESYERHKKRVRTLNEVADVLATYRPINHLCDMAIKDFTACKPHLSGGSVLKHAEHMVFESDRVMNIKTALDIEDLEWFAAAIEQSSRSLVELYEYVPNDLGFLLDIATTQHTLAARAANKTPYQLVYTLATEVPSAENEIVERYERTYKKKLTILNFVASDGLRRYSV